MFRKFWTYATLSRSHTFMVLGLLTLLLRIPLSLFPAFTERVYERGLFLGVRYLLDYTIGWSPIPFSYILILALIGYWAWKVTRRPKPAGHKGKRALLNLAGFTGAFLFFFHFLWGFNYERIPIEHHLGLGHDHNSLEANSEGKIHNGADDNASGTSGVIELARYFSKNGVKENP